MPGAVPVQTAHQRPGARFSKNLRKSLGKTYELPKIFRISAPGCFALKEIGTWRIRIRL